MNSWEFVAMLGSIIASTAAFIWVALRVGGQEAGKKPGQKADTDLTEAAEKDVEHIFNDEFREELRNRGRLHFENIIGENAMFLQQDLRLTTSQLNEYMKAEITRKLQEEFAKYEESINDARDLALDSITKTQVVVEQQRQVMTKQLADEVTAEKNRQIKLFQENMAEIVNHYVLAAIGDQIDLNDQLEFIISELEARKPEILQDMTHGT